MSKALNRNHASQATFAARGFGPEEATVGELIRQLARLRPRSLLGLVAAVATAGFSLFVAGQMFQDSAAAISLLRPFGMQMTTGDGTVVYPAGSLLLAPQYTDSNGNAVLLLRRIRENGLGDNIGEVTAQRPRFHIPLLAPLFAGLPMSSAFAQPHPFDWGKYKSNPHFPEHLVAPILIRRTYDDGAELEYQLDANGCAIESSRRWLS